MRVHDPMVYAYRTHLPFEAAYDVGPMTVWMKRHWSLSVLFSVLYVLTIFSIKWAMRRRERFALRLPLTIWNAALAIFSTVGAARMYPEFWTSIFEHGLVYSICNNSYAQGVTSFWATLFMLSKVVELGDTMFVVLRKQQLIFLHWYHHISVMIYTWYSFQEHTASGRWFIVMNFTVHAFMYSYYASRAMGFKLPKSIPWCITLLQLAQMCIGCAVSAASYVIKSSGGQCANSYANLHASLCMYATYFVLFAHFFWQHYYTAGGKFHASTAEEPTKANGSSGQMANGHAGKTNANKQKPL